MDAHIIDEPGSCRNLCQHPPDLLVPLGDDRWSLWSVRALVTMAEAKKSKLWGKLKFKSAVVLPNNKLKKGKRDGTPEKPTTPTTDTQEDGDQSSRRKVIINDEILGMQIKNEDFQKLREPRPPSSEQTKKTPPHCTVNVRKLRPASEWDRPKPKIISVAKPAPADAPLEPMDYASAAGPRFDQNKRIVPHSILGNVEDFLKFAEENGDLPRELTTPLPEEEEQKGSLTLKYEKNSKKRAPNFPKFESSNESNALKNWNVKMVERKKQQGYLSKLLNKAPDQLVMNQADCYRETQELRYLIERTIPTVDYGHGYRIGSEFWKQQEQLGDDLTGIQKMEAYLKSMTNTQTQKGYPAPIEHIGVPRVVLREKGTEWGRPKSGTHKPWHRSPYLRQRQQQLQPVMDELDSYKPNMMDLQIIGNNQKNRNDQQPEDDQGFAEMDTDENKENQQENDPLRAHPDVHPGPVFGPSLQFAGQPVRWTGDCFGFEGQVGVEARVTFEAYAGCRTLSTLEIANDGTTAIFFSWKSIPRTNPFDLLNANVQRFYFNTTNGVILPGDTVKIPFVFKSRNAGVFTEQWQLETRPVVCGGAMLIVTLRGVAVQQDKFHKQRTELEQYLATKQANQIVGSILSEVIEGIRSPERPSSPIDAYITEPEIFSRFNPELYYEYQTVQKLKELYRQLEEIDIAAEAAAAAATVEAAAAVKAAEEPKEEEGEEAEEVMAVEERRPDSWDLSVCSLKERIMGIRDDEEKQQEMLTQLNQFVLQLSFPALSPTQKLMYSTGYQLLSNCIDDFSQEALQLRSSLGMPERESDDLSEEPGAISARTQTASTSTRDSRKPAPKGGKGADKKAKDAKPPPKAPSQAQAKEVAKTGKTAAPSGAKRPTTREKDRHTPASGQLSPASAPASTGDPITEAKYKEKLHTQAYVLLGELLEKMEGVFCEIRMQDGVRPSSLT
ncbi:hypothetical protein CAPTEDRAFT_226990 [Capitella teleta]|uniref:MYCBP-associated protein n=1 Tax=Capitella teleta TaxID=283909 RepID=R7V6V4_CAPTE|nr:hypothetical protein CAPTEDRAFT_226990 [Capitella teleta]|eukprot:ELU14603.1 hypothetical protein CAPTEDRAFT_226990 [Capitella teleta]